VALRGGARIEGYAPDLPPLAEELLALLTVAAILGIMAWFVLRGRRPGERGAV
jgi:hypothetical protein